MEVVLLSETFVKPTIRKQSGGRKGNVGSGVTVGVRIDIYARKVPLDTMVKAVGTERMLLSS